MDHERRSERDDRATLRARACASSAPRRPPRRSSAATSARRRGDDEPRFGDRPPRRPPTARAPCSGSRSARRPTCRDPISEPVELPHWTQPPTGQVPADPPGPAAGQPGRAGGLGRFRHELAALARRRRPALRGRRRPVGGRRARSVRSTTTSAPPTTTSSPSPTSTTCRRPGRSVFADVEEIEERARGLPGTTRRGSSRSPSSTTSRPPAGWPPASASDGAPAGGHRAPRRRRRVAGETATSRQAAAVGVGLLGRAPRPVQGRPAPPRSCWWSAVIGARHRRAVRRAPPGRVPPGRAGRRGRQRLPGARRLQLRLRGVSHGAVPHRRRCACSGTWSVPARRRR